MQKLNILVLMAGAGKRFAEAGYTTPKPLVRDCNGKTILELTTSSLPFISHRGEATSEQVDYELTFAIQKSHDLDGSLTQYLQKTYGELIQIVPFARGTRGAIETALLSLKSLDCSLPLLVLDSDNKYNGKGFLEFLKRLQKSNNCIALCHFEPIDDTEKWCFLKLQPNGRTVLEVSEKKKVENGKPIMGVYYFSSTSIFKEQATKILDIGEMVNGEYYMSLLPKKILSERDPWNKLGHVDSYLVDKVVPLGTPGDFEAYNAVFSEKEE